MVRTQAPQLKTVSSKPLGGDLDKKQILMKTLQDHILELPDDWWKTTSSCQTLLQWFRTHSVGLLVAGQAGPSSQHAVYSGFLLEYGDDLLWMSAGHVIDDIDAILRSESFKITAMVWLDDFPVSGGENLIVHDKKLIMKSWENAGLDFGVIKLSVLDAANLRLNPRVNILEDRIWRHLDKANPEGYYLIGFPKDLVESSERPADSGRTWKSITAHIACVPLVEVPHKLDSKSDFWNDSGAFYARVIPYPDIPELELGSIVGMSGGPILSIERNNEGKLIYRLVGIQSTWLPSDQIVRAAPIAKISEVLEHWLLS